MSVELLADERQRRARRLADPKRQVAGLAPHRDDDVPASRGLRILHEIAHELDADVARRLEPERRHVRWQRQIVVDRLRARARCGWRRRSRSLM